MGFESILDIKEPNKGVTRPAFFLDLNIDQIIERATKGDRGVIQYFEYFPLDEECVEYRRMVYRDICECGLYDALAAFNMAYNEYRDIENKKNSTRVDLQKPVWNFCGMVIYTGCLVNLLEALKAADLKSEGFKELAKYLEEYAGTQDFISMKEKSVKLKTALDALSVTADYENGRIIVSVENGTEEEKEKSAEEDDEQEERNFRFYEEFLSGICATNEKEFVNPCASTDELTGFEQEIVKIVAKRNPDIFKEADKLYDEKNKYENTVFGRLADELRFYLSFYEFEEKMKKAGFAFTSPQKSEGERIAATGLYDLALACVNSEKGKPVISNDMSYEKGELFFVITGPNQGGKTTFARSLGQLVYFSKVGLDVPAKEASVMYFPDILTHFSVEESVETGRGKLMEELVRLSPMMKENPSDAFVVINELFTTAANYDAIIMGQNVLKHFLEQGCHGIYVTHLRELCDIDDRIVGLSAQLDENGKQNFKILKKAVDYEGCAKNQVEKYGLGYENLKKRLESIRGTVL